MIVQIGSTLRNANLSVSKMLRSAVKVANHRYTYRNATLILEVVPKIRTG